MFPRQNLMKPEVERVKCLLHEARANVKNDVVAEMSLKRTLQ